MLWPSIKLTKLVGMFRYLSPVVSSFLKRPSNKGDAKVPGNWVTWDVGIVGCGLEIPSKYHFCGSTLYVKRLKTRSPTVNILQSWLYDDYYCWHHS